MAKKSKKKTTKNKKKKSTSETSSRRVSHKGARAKGLQFERDVVNALGHIFPEAQRQLEYQTSDCKGTDTKNTGPFRIQCKNLQNYVSIKTIEEVKHNKKNDIPVLVTKGNRQKAMAVLPFEKLVTLLEVVYGLVPHWGEHKGVISVDAIQVDAVQCSEPRLISQEDISVNRDTALDQFI